MQFHWCKISLNDDPQAGTRLGEGENSGEPVGSAQLGKSHRLVTLSLLRAVEGTCWLVIAASWLGSGFGLTDSQALGRRSTFDALRQLTGSLFHCHPLSLPPS